MRFYKILILGLVLFSVHSFAQNSVGLLSYKPAETYDGYNLIYPHNQPNVYLLNNCGEVVHTWTDDENFRPGNTAYLRTDGTLVKTKRDAVITGDAIWAGGGGEFIEIRDWENNLMFSYALNNDSLRLHHDIAPMPNGNILGVAWENKSMEQAIQAGRDTALMDQDKVWSEYIFEINPESGEIVWEWHAWDHLIQDYDDTKDNFGIVADHPERIDLNYDTHDGHPDWLHINSIDYSFERDQILISVPYFDEVWIIDHSTSTEGAAGSTAGFSNKGGDLMYRWGNPIAYDNGDESDQRLYFQHDAHFIDDHIMGNNPLFNSIGVFNNRVGEDFSNANVFTPEWDMYNWEYTQGADLYLPEDHRVTLQHPDPQSLYSTGLSSVQLLPNDNYLITSGRFGYSFELSPDNEIVWEYKTPIRGGSAVPQGDTLTINNNLTFRMDRYPTDFDAFDGRDLSAKGYIELEPDTLFCFNIINDVVTINDYNLKVYPNPANNYLIVDWDGEMYTHLDIYNTQGQLMRSIMRTGGREYLDVSGFLPGTYLIQMEGIKYARFTVVR